MPTLVFKISENQSLDFPLAGEHVRLGRNPANDIVIDNSWISSFHAEFQNGPAGVEVRDLNSSNGTFVNGRRIQTAILQPGDTVAFGQLEATFDSPRAAGPDMPAVNAGAALKSRDKAVPLTPAKTASAATPAPAAKPVVPRPVATQPVPDREPRLAEALPLSPKPRPDEVAADAAAGRLAEAEQALTALRREREEEEKAFAARRTAAEKESASAEEALRRIKDEVATAGDRHSARLAELAAAEQALESKQRSLTQTESAKREAEASLVELRSQSAGLARETAQRREELARTQQETAHAAEHAAICERRVGEASAAVADIEARLASLRDEENTLRASVAAVSDELARRTESASTSDAAASALEKRFAAREQELAAADGRLQTLTAEIGAVDSELHDRRAALQQHGFELTEAAQRLARLRAEITEANTARAAVRESAKNAAAQLPAVEAKLADSRKQAADAATLEGRAASLRREIDSLEERQRTFAQAPDPNWGTVHAISKGIIKQIDLIDDVLNHLITNGGSQESIEQLGVFRAGLADILAEYHVEPYAYPEGFTVDVAARKKIQIVENRNDSGHGTRIERTYRPGYLCTNGALGVQTLLRKAEVAILIGN